VETSAHQLIACRMTLRSGRTRWRFVIGFAVIPCLSLQRCYQTIVPV